MNNEGNGTGGAGFSASTARVTGYSDGLLELKGDAGISMLGQVEMNGNKITGIGVGQGFHPAGANGYDGLVRITPDGVLHIHTGVGNLGTYSHSAPSRVAAEFLNYDWNHTVIERGDDRRALPWNSGQGGSNTASTESRTMYVAALDMKDKLLDIAAQMLGGLRPVSLRLVVPRYCRQSQNPLRRNPRRLIRQILKRQHEQPGDE